MAEHSSDFYRCLYDVARTINSSLELGEVLQRITRVTAETLNVKASSLRLLSRDGKLLIAGAAYGLSQGYMRKGPVEIEKSLVDQEVLTNKTIIIPDATQDARFQYPDRAREEGIRSVLVVPLAARGTIIGLMRIYTAEIREFTDEEIEFLGLIADLSALAIDNARLYQVVKGDYESVISFRDRLFDD
jgi:GAF domain-containing protein